MRVLVFELDFDFGGIESFILNFINNVDLKSEGLQIDLVTSVDGHLAFEDKFIRENVSIIHTPSKKNLLRYKRGLEEIVQRNQYDIMHIQKNSLSNSIPVGIAVKYGIPFIVHAQNSASSYHNLVTEIIHKIQRQKLKKVKCIRFACGYNAAMWMFGTTNDVSIIKNGINTGDFIRNDEIRKAVREDLEIGNEFTICNVGRFTRQKNHAFIIEIFNELKKKHPNSKLILVGDGEKFVETKRLVDKYNLEKDVYFCGALTRDEESKMLIASDVFLMPSLYEGVSIASMEAQMAGLSLLMSDTVDRDTDITGNVCFMSLEEPAERWAETIVNKLMLNLPKYDEKVLVECFRKHGYDMTHTSRMIIETYRKMVNEKSICVK